MNNALFLTLACALWVCVGFSACGDTHQESEAVAKANEKISQLREQGETARKNSRFDQSIKLHTEEFKLAESIHDTISMVKALNNIGTNYRRLGILDEATRYHHDALLLIMKLANQEDETVKKNRLISLNGLGNIFLSMGDLVQADSIFRLTLNGERELGNILGQAINLANIGTAKERMGQTDSAIIYYRHSLALNKQVRSTLGEALCFSHFANIHEQQGKYDEAIEEYRHAYEVISDSPDDWHKLEACVNVAKLYIRQGDFKRAQEFLKNGDATARRIHSLEHRSKIHRLYYQLYEKQGNIRAALDNYILSSELKDSLMDMKKLNQIQNMRLSLEREEYLGMLNQANKRYMDERSVRRITTTVLIIIIIMAIAIIATLWYTLRERNNTQRILRQMNKSREDFFANIAIDPADLKSADKIISDNDRQFIGRFTDAVYSQLSKGKADVESVASQLSLSSSQLNRRIQEITGQSTSTYITQIRLSKAKRMLRADVNTPIGDIATKCGFDDVAQFTRFFKQQTNITPTDYRKMI